MASNQNFEYVINTTFAFLISLLIWLPFLLLFGNSLLLWSVFMLVGGPHFVLGILGYLATDTRKLIGPFLTAAVFGGFLALIFYRVLPDYLAYFLFLAYFMIHLLSNEQMFESSIVKSDYRSWQNSWPRVFSWGSIALILIALTISALRLFGGSSSLILGSLWMLLLILGGALIYKYFEQTGNGQKIPHGFMVIFVLLLVPVILFFGYFWNGLVFAPTVLLAIFHIVSWYVFYTRRLAKFPKNDEQVGLAKFIFYWRGNIKRFYFFVAILQAIWLGLFLLYFYSPVAYIANSAGILISPLWAPFWTIMHVTTSFLPKPAGGKFTLPSFSLVRTAFRSGQA